MSPQREGESLEMYMYRLEMTQERQESDIERMSSRVDTVEAVALEAKSLAMDTNSMMQTMPQKIIEAIEKKNKEKKLEARDWVVVIFGLAGTISGIIVGVIK